MKSAIALIAVLAIFITVIVIAVRVMGWKATLAISATSVVVNYILNALIRMIGD